MPDRQTLNELTGTAVSPPAMEAYSEFTDAYSKFRESYDEYLRRAMGTRVASSVPKPIGEVFKRRA